MADGGGAGIWTRLGWMVASNGPYWHFRPVCAQLQAQRQVTQLSEPHFPRLCNRGIYPSSPPPSPSIVRIKGTNVCQVPDPSAQDQ